MAIDIIARGMIESSKSDISQLFDITKGGEIVNNESSYTINNAVEYPLLGLKLYGKSTQNVFCGKNLFDYRLIKSKTENGVTFTNNNDGSFTLSGSKTNVSNSFLAFVNYLQSEAINIFAPGNYTLSSSLTPNSNFYGYVNIYYNDKSYFSIVTTRGTGKKTFAITEEMLSYDNFRLQIGFYSPANKNVNTVTGTFNLQFEAGDTATDFEPYVGGIPSPNPEFPQEIKNVGDSGAVGIAACGKNLFDYSILKGFSYNGITYTNNNDGSFTVSGVKTDISKLSYCDYKYNHKESLQILSSPGTYTISGVPKDYGKGLHFYINFYYGGKSYNNFLDTKFNTTNTVTEDMFTEDFRIDIGFYSAPNYECNNGTFYPQIEKGSTATDFEPYKGATASITTALPLCGIPVDSGGNYTDSNGQQWVCDELIYNADGTGKIIKRTAKIDSYNGEAVSGMYISSTGGLDTGATVIYQIDTPQESELTAAEMAVLSKLQTFDGVSNISNDSGADMDVKYCTNKVLSEYVFPITTGLQKQIDELKAAVLSLGGNV